MKYIKPLSLAATAAIGLGLSGCAHQYYYNENTARYTQPATNSYVLPVSMDLDIRQEKITYEQTFANTLTKLDVDVINNGGTCAKVVKWKEGALAMAAKKHNADVIIAPLFEIETNNDYNNNIIVRVTGFPATFKNLRMAKPEDMEMVKIDAGTQQRSIENVKAK